jgi:hypothetical protein
MKTKGVSTIIAVVLLIAITTILAISIFLFSKSFIPEPILLSERAAELSCPEVNLNADVFGNNLEISTNLPLAGILVKHQSIGKTNVYEIKTKLTQGSSTVIDLLENSILTNPGESLLIIPILQGETSDGIPTPYTCDDNHGTKILI